ncbi:hypothetical protein [Streptomyces xantholiticus]|nr:hypothetical protein [Streptomyces xantholiticus]GGW73054.1 hypothetical protein GCM10010381_67250 [Streptomyces xantholiticus]
MNELDTRTTVMLLAGAGATYIAFLHPAVGVALLVGVAVISVLHFLMK